MSMFLKRKEIRMSRNLMRMALIMAATAAYAQDDIFGCSSPRLDAPSGNIPSDKQKCQSKAQHEFIIKGLKLWQHLRRMLSKSIIIVKSKAYG